MSYQEVYKQKLTTADEAVKAVKSGDWVDYGWSVCSADALDKALARRMGELTDVKIRGGILTHKPAIFDVPNAAEHFCWNSWHMGGIERKAVSEGFSYYIPCGILSCRGITATASRAWTWPCSRWPPWTSTAGSISVPAAPT